MKGAGMRHTDLLEVIGVGSYFRHSSWLCPSPWALSTIGWL